MDDNLPDQAFIEWLRKHAENEPHIEGYPTHRRNCLIAIAVADGSQSLKDIADRHHLSRERVRQIHAKLWRVRDGELRYAAKLAEEAKTPVDTRMINWNGFSMRSMNCLRNEGITTNDALRAKTSTELLRIANLGQKSLREIVEYLDDLGWQLKDWELDRDWFKAKWRKL
jgi:DNA-directed RNA polymerase alpha subunit